MKNFLTSCFLLLPFSFFLLLSGCSRDGAAEKDAAVPPSSPASYMKDPELKARFAAKNDERKELVKARSAVVEKMTAMIEAKKKELGTSDEAALKAALEKDPEWNALYRRCTDANTAIDENRRSKMAVFRERVTRQSADAGAKGAKTSK